MTKSKWIKMLITLLVLLLLCLAGCGSRNLGSETKGTEEAAPSSAETSKTTQAVSGETTPAETGQGTDPISEPVVLAPKATEEENLADLQAYVRYIEQDLVDEDGYVLNESAMQQLLDTFYEEAVKACESGAYLGVHRNEDNVALRLKSGLLYIYMPYRKGFMSGGDEAPELSCYIFDYGRFIELGPEKYNWSEYNEHDDLRNMAAESEYHPDYQQFFEKGFTFKNLTEALMSPGKKIVVINSHGGLLDYSNGHPVLTSEYHPGNTAKLQVGTGILTADIYDPRVDYELIGILKSNSNKELLEDIKWFFGINQDRKVILLPEFFEKLSEKMYLKDTVIHLGICHGAQFGEDNRLIQTSLGKGADVVVGYDESVTWFYNYLLGKKFIPHLLDARYADRTFREILEEAKGEAEIADDALYRFHSEMTPDKKNQYSTSNDYKSEGTDMNVHALIFGRGKDWTVEKWLLSEVAQVFSFLYTVTTWAEMTQRIEELGWITTESQLSLLNNHCKEYYYPGSDPGQHSNYLIIREKEDQNAGKSLEVQIGVSDTCFIDLGNGVVVGNTTVDELKKMGFDLTEEPYLYSFSDEKGNRYSCRKSTLINDMTIIFPRILNDGEEDQKESSEPSEEVSAGGVDYDLSFLRSVTSLEELRQKMAEEGLRPGYAGNYYIEDTTHGKYTVLSITVDYSKINISVVNCCVDLGNGIVLGRTTKEQLPELGVNIPRKNVRGTVIGYQDEDGNAYWTLSSDGVLSDAEIRFPNSH